MLNGVNIDTVSFSGHESFPLRFSWLKKGYDEILADSGFFGREDAMILLGTGKNMVRSIRHWGLACNMWDEVPHSRGREVEPTAIGHLFLADDGWDPYMEDVGTIWWLHWMLVRNSGRATAWTWTFGRPKSNLLRKDELVAELEQLIDDVHAPKVSRASLKRDVEVLIRTYARTGKRADIEDNLDAPFNLLNLVRQSGEKGIFEIVQGPQSSLPTGIFEAALVDYLHGVGKVSATLDELCYGPLTPGRTFRLSEDALAGHLMRLVSSNSDLYAFDETAGLRQALVKGPLPNREQILERHYRGAHRDNA